MMDRKSVLKGAFTIQFRKVVYIHLILASFLLIITGCVPFGFGPGLADYSYHLAGDYELNRLSANDIKVMLNNESNVPGNMIPAKVVKISWNETYIIAEQQGFKRQFPNDPDDNHQVPDNVFYYWILDAPNKKAYGPFDKVTFESKKKAFQIPDSMVLKDVDSYPKDA
jgi:hypothetical protein